MGDVIEVTDSSFDKEVLKSALPVVVDFWAEWCGPCRLIAPIVKDLAKEMNGKVRFAKLDVDANPRTTTAYGIQSIPTLIFFRAGNPVGQQVGALSKEALRASVEERVGKG
jgi:thioredoxin 1